MQESIKKIYEAVEREQQREALGAELIASENYVSEDIMRLCGSVLTNKYAEGYPEAASIARFKEEFPDYVHTGNTGRYYGGCEHIDWIELYARYMFQKAFQTNYHVNVQPHSGSSANLAAYSAVLSVGDTVLSMQLDNGGHLTHGSSVNMSGKLYNFCFYDVDSTGRIDYEDVARKASELKPKLILAGASAYSRIIDFARFGEIAKENGALFMVDMAHIAGLVAAGEHPSPFGIADIVTTTTHKTLRGTRGGLIFCKPELAKKIDSAVFPGAQGGGLQHVVAAKAATACEACSPEYKEYIHNVVVNAKAMCEEFVRLGYEVVSGGTDNHLFLIDFSHTHPHLTGKQVQEALGAHGITVNKNCVPDEKRSPAQTSGIRVGTAAMTTCGYGKEEFLKLASTMHEIISDL